MTSEPNLAVGKIYLRSRLIAENTTFYNNHLHFEIRRPEPESGSANYKNSCNPFVVDTALRTSDGQGPNLDYLFVDGDTAHQGDATISPWNFLDCNFDDYYDSTAASPFIQCLLPDTSRDNDLDDPHFLVSGECKVRFVLRAKDRASDGSGSTPHCAPYIIALYLDTALMTDPSEDRACIEGAKPFYKVRFDTLLNVNNRNERWDEEDVYHTESPLRSHIADQTGDSTRLYFRLYPYDANDNGLPGCILQDNSLLADSVLRTEDLEEGIHRIRLYARDIRTNDKIADVHFYIHKSDWVDFCRGLKE